MFGGIGLLLNGIMLVGVWKDSLIVRLGDEQGEEVLLETHVKPFDIAGYLASQEFGKSGENQANRENG